MNDQVGIPVCFSAEDPVVRPGKRVLMMAYQTKIADQIRLLTLTWCKNLLLVSIEEKGEGHSQGKVELKPWYFWKKQGSRHLIVDGKTVEVAWDLRAAKFNGETEPISDYYVAFVYENEVVLVVGDLKKEAFRKTGCRPALIDPILVSRKEHVSGRRKFSTRAKFGEKGNFFELSIECKNDNGSSNSFDGVDPELEIKIDGNLALNVKHLQWKFRGNQSIWVGEIELQVYWDVHDWFFNTNPRHGLFIFIPIFSSPQLSSLSSLPLSADIADSALGEKGRHGALSGYCLVIYAWKTA
ncbi:hypothetical protein L6164_025194 [Bauhinia variegata]|uniref:Uncharacterized protein n=1 Tax=Bauhinia variegata TaxID=167791 RepID=A0ACB9M072_BAUVA|nr:hypothetical protein L6164_025194 [Bauhinia variegata]